MFPSFSVGGAQARFCAVANRMGASVAHVIVSMDGGLACRERLDPALCVTYPALAAKRRDPVGRVRRMRTALRAWQPDVLLTHNWGAIEWAVANAPPGLRPVARHVHVEDGFGPEERDRQIARRVIARRVALRRSTVLLPSHTLLSLARDVWRLPPASLRYLPNGVDLSRPSPPVAADDGVTVGVVAALRPEKNLARLVTAIAAVPSARLLVVGDGPERAALADLAARLGIAGRVTFAGHLADPAAAYARMAVFALSSDTEQMPLTVLEAMAAGLPVAATDVGDVARMVAPENRPFIVPRSPEPLAAALRALLADPALRRSVGAANRRRVEAEYGQERMFADWAALLRGEGNAP